MTYRDALAMVVAYRRVEEALCSARTIFLSTHEHDDDIASIVVSIRENIALLRCIAWHEWDSPGTDAQSKQLLGDLLMDQGVRVVTPIGYLG